MNNICKKIRKGICFIFPLSTSHFSLSSQAERASFDIFWITAVHSHAHLYKKKNTPSLSLNVVLEP